MKGDYRVGRVESEQLRPTINNLKTYINCLSITSNGSGKLSLENEIQLFRRDVTELNGQVGDSVIESLHGPLAKDGHVANVLTQLLGYLAVGKTFDP